MTRIVLTAMLTSAFALWAGEKLPNSPEYEACLAKPDAASGYTEALMDCAYNEYKRQDARLNRAYQQVITRLKRDAADLQAAGMGNCLAQMRIVQLAWLKYVTAKCDYTPFDERGASTKRQSLWSHSCLLDATQQRADELEAMLEW